MTCDASQAVRRKESSWLNSTFASRSMWPFKRKESIEPIEAKSAPLSGYSYVMPFVTGSGMQRSAEAYAREGCDSRRRV